MDNYLDARGLRCNAPFGRLLQALIEFDLYSIALRKEELARWLDGRNGSLGLESPR